VEHQGTKRRSDGTSDRTPSGGENEHGAAPEWAAAALRESEEHFRQVFEEGPLGMVVSSVSEGRFTAANSALSQMLGYGEDELTGKTFAEITHPDDRARDVEAVQRIRDGQLSRYKTEKRYLKRNGETLWARVAVSLIHARDGRPLHFLAIVEDIT
jgi:PAS domain S-box-containing protein